MISTATVKSAAAPTSPNATGAMKAFGASVLLLACRSTLLVLLFLLGWSILPTSVGMESRVVMSGSMAPAIQPGDVIVVQRIKPEDVRPGQIIVVNDPVRKGSVLSHRLEGFDERGNMVLKGDANSVVDTSAVTADAYRGVARLVVPAIGLPKYWIDETMKREVVLATLGLALITSVTTFGQRWSSD